MNTFFRFKQFVVHQERTAMKVGTDGVLLGSLASWPSECDAPKRILDVGTGTGLIAIMMAQRFAEASVLGVDVDADAVAQAADNFAASPFASRLCSRLQDVRSLESSDLFDMVVSNPPYFAGDLQCPNGQRNLARHTVGLGHAELMEAVSRLLREGGRVAIIVPAEAEKNLVFEAEKRNLWLSHSTLIYSVIRKPAKRVVCQFVKGCRADVVRDTLVLLNPDGSMSDDYKRVTCDFYLDK